MHRDAEGAKALGDERVHSIFLDTKLCLENQKMAILHGHLELLDALKDDLVQKKHANVENRNQIQSRVEAYANKVESLTGDFTIQKLYRAFDLAGMTRTETQVFFHKKFVEAILPHVYGKEEFNRFKERILEENGINSKEFNQYTLISTPRRWGKTTSVAIFVAACLLAVPNIWISVYSTGRRASKALGDLVHKYLIKMETESRVQKSKVIIKNTEELFYGEGSDVRRLYSYPATVQVRFGTNKNTRSNPNCYVLRPTPKMKIQSQGFFCLTVDSSFSPDLYSPTIPVSMCVCVGGKKRRRRRRVASVGGCATRASAKSEELTLG